MFGALRRLQAKRPLVHAGLQTAVLFATGDAMAQHGVEGTKGGGHDFTRTLRMAAYGGFVFGPVATKWFGLLQKRIIFPGRPNTEIVARVAADQCLFASTNLFFFLSSMAVMEGTDPKKKLESTYFKALQKNWMIWPAVQFINFKYVPLPQRVLVVNVVSLGWNCYMSYLNSQPGPHEKFEALPPDV